MKPVQLERSVAWKLVHDRTLTMGSDGVLELVDRMKSTLMTGRQFHTVIADSSVFANDYLLGFFMSTVAPRLSVDAVVIEVLSSNTITVTQ